MPPPSPTELKRALVREGFEIYRTVGSFVLLADRVRDNLIMDSGVALGFDESLSSGAGETAPDENTRLVVRIVLKAQASEFPSENPEQLVARAQQLAAPFEARGYAETERQTIVVKDPGNPDRILDTWHEIRWERSLTGLAAAVAELRFALAEKKTAGTNDDD